MKSASVKILLLFIKILLMLFSLIVIYRQVIIKENLTDFIKDTLLLSQTKSFYLLLVVLLLMLINWYIEVYKWWYLISRIYPLSIPAACSAVLSGITISFFTPNRTGEFAGRVMHLPEGIRIKGTLITFIGNAAQLLTTIIFGSTAFAFCFQLFFELSTFQNTLLVILTFAVNFILLILYFKIGLFDSILQKIKWFRPFVLQTHVIKEYKTNMLAYVLLQSAIRYLIFTTQFILMLYLFDNTIEFVHFYAAVAIVFLIITVVPTIALTELAIRGSVAVTVISLFGGNSLHILEATFLLWIINLVLPAIVGSFTLLTLKLSKQD